MKIYRRHATMVMLIIVLGLTLLAGLVVKYDKPEVKENAQWKQSLEQKNEQMRQNMAKDHGATAQSYYKSEIAINQYRIDQDLKPNEKTMWQFVEDSASNLVAVIIIFTIITVATSIASEFDTGTIKQLMIRPIYRTKILLSKYVSSLLFSVVCLIVLFAFSWLLGGILFGFNGVNEIHLGYVDGAVQTTSWTLAIWKSYLFSSVSLLIMVTLAGAIAAMFRSGALAIGLTIFLYMGATIFVQLLSGYNWVKYVLFANLDLTQYTIGPQLREDMSLGFSLVVLSIYYIIFVLLGWLFYTKRDIKA
jgi:ABC-2 type transport system permease protein